MLPYHGNWIASLKILKLLAFTCLRWAFRVVWFNNVSFLSASSDSLHPGPWRHFFAGNNPAKRSDDTSIAGQGFHNIFRIDNRLSYESVMLNSDTGRAQPGGFAPDNQQGDSQMIVEYRCSCGFKTIFPHKYIRHTTSCTDRPQPEKDQRAFRVNTSAAGSDLR